MRTYKVWYRTVDGVAYRRTKYTRAGAWWFRLRCAENWPDN